MQFYFNELSYHGQLASKDEFIDSLIYLMDIRKEIRNNEFSLYVSQRLRNRIVYDNTSFINGMQIIADINLKRYILGWIQKEGPHIENAPIIAHGDIFKYKGADISIYALAEAAALKYIDPDIAAVSISPSNFSHSPLSIEYWRSRQLVTSIDVENIYQIGILKNIIATLQPAISSWSDWVSKVKRDFPNIDFLPDFEVLSDNPNYNKVIANAGTKLIDVLNRYKESFNHDGTESHETRLIKTNYFNNKNAKFSDSSDSEKGIKIYQDAVTFQGDQYWWHGKVKYNQYRLHFKWAFNQSDTIKIAYFGPKLTKQ